MLVHFLHPAVWISYTAAVLISLLTFSYVADSELQVTLIGGLSLALVGMDYVVHSSVHGWKLLPIPFPSLLWMGAVCLIADYDFITAAWQLVGIYLAQAVWDNSWHAAHHHRGVGQPRAELDHPLVRWGAVIVAASSVMVFSLF